MKESGIEASFPQSVERESTLRQAQGDSVMVSLSNHGCPIKDFGHDKIKNSNLWTNSK